MDLTFIKVFIFNFFNNEMYKLILIYERQLIHFILVFSFPINNLNHIYNTLYHEN